jgi:hypothetical protein
MAKTMAKAVVLDLMIRFVSELDVVIIASLSLLVDHHQLVSFFG